MASEWNRWLRFLEAGIGKEGEGELFVRGRGRPFQANPLVGLKLREGRQKKSDDTNEKERKERKWKGGPLQAPPQGAYGTPKAYMKAQQS